MKNILSQFGFRVTTGHLLWAAVLTPACVVIFIPLNLLWLGITLGVITGTTWAFLSLRGDWIREPRIAISFLTWGAYLALVCLRVTAGWRGRKAAILTVAVVGFSAMTWAAHARLGQLLFKQ